MTRTSSSLLIPARAAVEVSRNGVIPVSRDRVRVDGKFFSRGGQRLRVHGVTYGPFAPNEAGEPFPSPQRAADDLTQMRTLGINSIRTYHVPPTWLLEAAEAQGVHVF